MRQNFLPRKRDKVSERERSMILNLKSISLYLFWVRCKPALQTHGKVNLQEEDDFFFAKKKERKMGREETWAHF